MPLAMGFIETKGYTGLIEATDAMTKEARVEFVRQEQIGGSFATTMVRGDVGAVRAAVAAGEAAAGKAGEFHAANVIANIHPAVDQAVIGGAPTAEAVNPADALGLIEMQGFTPMVEAADAAAKAASVVVIDYVSVGAGHCCAVVRGDVAACRTAIDAGQASGGRAGPVVAAQVIPRPHPPIHAITRPPGPKTETVASEDQALGIIETKGFVATVEALDQATKAAQVVPVGWQRVGSACSAVIFQGDVAAVRSGVEAGMAAAEQVGKVISCHVIPRPHEAVGGVIPAPRKH